MSNGCIRTLTEDQLKMDGIPLGTPSRHRGLMRTTRPLSVGLGLALVFAAGACGSDDDAARRDGGQSGADVTRNVDVEMHETVYIPDIITVEAGDTVRFAFTNAGTVVHDAVIGDADTQPEHDDKVGGGHVDDEDAISLEPGGKGELVYSFEAGDEVLIGCYEPGHFGSGERMTIEVL